MNLKIKKLFKKMNAIRLYVIDFYSPDLVDL